MYNTEMKGEQRGHGGDFSGWEGLVLGHTHVGLLFGLLAQAGIGDRGLHLSCGR